MTAREFYVRMVRRGCWRVVVREVGRGGVDWATWTEQPHDWTSRALATLSGQRWCEGAQP